MTALQQSWWGRRTAALIILLAGGVLFAGLLRIGAQTPDRSWLVSEYVRIGMADPGKYWTASDYAVCCVLLRELDRTNRAAFPRLGNPSSGPLFARIINPTNTLTCLQNPFPARERLALYQSLIIFLPSILDLYKLSGVDTTFHQETVELAHTHLHLLRLALELDGKPLPRGPGETNSILFRLGEQSLTRWNAPYNDPDNYRVPRNGYFTVLGAHAARTFIVLVPWLVDRTVLPDPERLAATRYLNEEMPLIWAHIVRATRNGLMDDLNSVIERTRHPEVRAGLERLRDQLNAKTEQQRTQP